MNLERRATVYVGLIFASGLLLGGTAMNLAEHFWLHPRTDAEYDLRQHDRVAAELSAGLNLTRDQEAKADQVFANAIRAYATLERQMAPQFDAIRRQGRDSLRAILDPAQRQNYDTLVRRVDMEYPNAVQPAALPDPCGVLAAPLPPMH